MDTVSDVATTLFGDDDATVEQAAFPTPTPMVAAPLAFPVQTVCAVSECQQCVRSKQSRSRLSVFIDTANGHCCMESGDGDESMKGTADRIICTTAASNWRATYVSRVSSDSEWAISLPKN